jgi:hypothetical protein
VATQAALEYIVKVQDRELAVLRKNLRDMNKALGVETYRSTSTASKGFNNLDRSVGKTNRTLGQSVRGAVAGSGAFRGLGRAIAFASGAYLGAAGFSAVIRSGIDELQDQGRVAAQTNAVIKSTGAVAGVTAKEVDGLSQALLRKTGIDDETIKSGENMLLTFRNIRNVAGENNDIFDQATKATLDLSVAMGGDMTNAAIRVGKALNDPVRGITALRRVGVQFTAQQEAQVKAMVESGNVMGAQRIILRELNAEFGGSAAAYGRTLPGAISKARESFQNLEAEVLKGLTPSMNRAAQAVSKWTSNSDNMARVQKDVNDVIAAAKDVFKILRGTIEFLDKVTGSFKNTLLILMGVKVAATISGWVTSLEALIGAEAAAGAGATGLAGASGAAALLRARWIALGRLAPIGLVVTLAVEGKGISDWLRNNIPGLKTIHGWTQKLPGNNFDPLAPPWEWGNKKPGSSSTGLVQPPGAGTPTVARAGGIQLPRSFVPTHQTAGLAGFPAVDIMARPGTPIGAPEDGQITRISGNDPGLAPPQGQGGPWGLSIYFVGASGTTYYMTHLLKVGREGSYRKGQVIGVIGDYPGSPADHVHFGIHRGKSAQAYFASINVGAANIVGGGVSTPSVGGRSRGAKSPNTPPPPRKSTTIAALQALADQAGITPGKADDIAALRNLRTAIASQKIGGFTVGGISVAEIKGLNEKQLAALSAAFNQIDSINGQIDSLTTKAKAKKKKRVAAFKLSDIVGFTDIQANVATAKLAGGDDYVAALTKEQAFLKRALDKAKGHKDRIIKIAGELARIATQIKSAKKTVKKSDLIPISLQQDIADAQLGGDSDALLAALQREEKIISRARDAAKGVARLDLTGQLADVRGQIKGIQDDATAATQKIIDEAKSAADAAAEFKAAFTDAGNQIAEALGAANALPTGLVTELRNQFGQLVEIIPVEDLRRRIYDLNAQLANAITPEDVRSISDRLAELAPLISQAMDQVQQALQQSLDRLEGAFSDISDRTTSVFDAQTQAMLDDLDAQEAALNDTQDAVQSYGKSLSAAATRLKELQERHKAFDNQISSDEAERNLSDAQTKLEHIIARRGGGAVLQEARQAVADAQNRITDLRLTAEEESLQKIVDAEQETQSQQTQVVQREGTKRLTAQRLELTSMRNEQRRQLTAALAEFETYAENTTDSAETKLKKLNGIFQQYGIGPIANTGALMGTSFANAFQAVLDDFFNTKLPAYLTAKGLVNAIISTPTGQVTATVSATTGATGGGSTPAYAPGFLPYVPGMITLPGKVYGFASGALVRGGRGGVLARVGEGSHDEAVVPLDGKSLGGDVHLHFHEPIYGNVEEVARQLAGPIRDAILDKGRNTSSLWGKRG